MLTRSGFVLLLFLGFEWLFAQPFYADSLLTEQITPADLSKEEWMFFSLEVPETLFLEVSGFGHVILYTSTGKKLQTGSILKGSEKDYFSFRNILRVAPGSYLVKVRGNHPLFDSEKFNINFISEDDWRSEERNRFLTQGLFFGIVIVMALYNLMIYFAVKDQSYVWYVLSIVGFGFYMSFYYGFTLEFLWPERPVWNAYFFALIIPLTNISRIFFTRTYLHTRTYVPVWHKSFKIISILYLIPIGGWAICYSLGVDQLTVVNHIIGTLGSLNMIMITAVSYIVYRKGYQPALWFLLAFVLFNFGGVLFIFQELGYLPDNFLTRYIIQIGAVAQVILFSMGLSSRLNRTTELLNMRTLEKERMAKNQEIEKKNLIEHERKKLEEEVRKRTRDLESILNQLKLSEEELRELNELKNRLFSIISHELKNPLTTVDSFLNLLINHYHKLSPEELSALSNKTKFALQNLTLLLDNLMLWSRLQQDRLVFDPGPIEISKVVERSIKLFKLLIEQKNLNLKIDQSVYDYTAFADKDMLAFVMRNLIHNSIKFTPKNGSVSISIALVNSHMVRCKIEDSGIGMNETMITQILDQNKAFSTVGTEEEKGSGLGLIMCKDFVEKNGGELMIASKKGTTVSFSVPVTSEALLP